jgi:hypothetical protein
VDLLVMEARGMPARDSQQARHRLFGDLHESRRSSDTPAFSQMVDNVFRGGFGKLGIE